MGKIKLKLPGSKKDPNTAAEVELPIDMPGMSPTLIEGLNRGVRLQARKNVRANSFKRDPETGKLVPYEEWKAQQTAKAQQSDNVVEFPALTKAASTSPGLANLLAKALGAGVGGTVGALGGGAGAVVLEASAKPGILAARMYADGSYDENVLGLTARIDHGELCGRPYINMDGRQVFKLAVDGLTSSAQEVAVLAGVDPQDVDVYIPHQANLRIMTMVAKKLGIPDERMIKTVSEQGNTSAASVPLALDEAVRSGKISDGSLVLLQAVGAGMAWGSAIVRWRSE